MSFIACFSLKNFADPMLESLSHKAVGLFWFMLLLGCAFCQIIPVTIECHGKINLGFTEIDGNCLPVNSTSTSD